MPCFSLPDLLETTRGFCYGLGISLWGAMVTCHVRKTQHVLEKEQTPLLAEAGTVGCGYILYMMPLLTRECECGVPVTDTCQLEFVVPSGDTTSLHE